MYFTILIALSLVSLFLFIIIAAKKKMHISISFLIADIIFTIMSLSSYFIFNYALIHFVSTYALCAFGFGVGVGIMWSAAVKIFKKKKEPPERVKAEPVRPKLSSISTKKPGYAEKKPDLIQIIQKADLRQFRIIYSSLLILVIFYLNL